MMMLVLYDDMNNDGVHDSALSFSDNSVAIAFLFAFFAATRARYAASSASRSANISTATLLLPPLPLPPFLLVLLDGLDGAATFFSCFFGAIMINDAQRK